MRNITKKDKRIPLMMILFGIILFLDELWMFGISFGGFLGDWTSLHQDPYHHWMLGIILILVGGYYYEKHK